MVASPGADLADTRHVRKRAVLANLINEYREAAVRRDIGLEASAGTDKSDQV